MSDGIMAFATMDRVLASVKFLDTNLHRQKVAALLWPRLRSLDVQDPALSAASQAQSFHIIAASSSMFIEFKGTLTSAYNAQT
jgi:hypothetical protein